MTAFSFDGFNLNDGTTYRVLAAGSQLLAPAPLRHTVEPYTAVPRAAILPRPPGPAAVPLAILVQGASLAALQSNVDALLGVLARPGRALVVTLGTTARRATATVTAISLTAMYPTMAVYAVTFTADSYWEAVSPSGSVQTGALSSLVALGLETGNAYGHRLSLTPGGNAPTTPRVLIAVQAGSQTPTRFTLRALATSPPEIVSLNLSLSAGYALQWNPDLYSAISAAMSSVIGYWPLADSGLGPKDFSTNSRDLSHTSSYRTAVTADSPVAWWRLEETSGSSAADSSGANTGTYQNSPTLGAAGLIAEAGTYGATLNGTNQYVTFADAAAVDVGDTFSIELWLRRAHTTAGTYQLFDKGDQAMNLKLNSSGALVLAKVNVAEIVTSTSAITDTNTHHVVCTKTGATVKLYLDGVDVTGSVANQTVSSNALSGAFGASRTGAQPFPGTLDEVALYNTALSAARVSAHYSAGTAADNVLYNQDGPLYGAVEFDGTAGEFYSASASFSLAANISCGAWVNADAIGALMGIMGKATTNAGFWLGVTAAGLLTGGVGSGAATRSATGTTTLSAGRWYHAVLVWDSAAYTVTLYLDGEREGYASGGALTVGGYAGNFTVGSAKDLSTTARYWNGRLAEPWVLSAALTQTQVRAIYRRGLLAYNGSECEPAGMPWPQLHGESSESATPYEVRVTHASTAPDLRVALAWRGQQVTP